MVEAKNKYYLEDGNIEEVIGFIDDNSEKSKIIYEVLRVVSRRALFLNEHIKRMEKSFDIVGKVFPFSYDKVSEYVETMISANGDVDGNIKLTYNTETEAFKVYYIAHKYPDKSLYKSGVRTILYHGERENPNAKIIDKSFREKVTEAINKANVYEAILVDNKGNITEGSKSNIFFIKDGRLITASAKAVLQGVTRARVISVAKELNIEVKEIEINYKEVAQIDAMFISGTSSKVLPISYVDDVKMDTNNKELRLIMSKFDELIEKYLRDNNKG